jgi:outer membrane receptor for ferrienterochelin and colicin
LNRISASQVERIELIRGTSGDLAVRGSSQVVNIVLTEVETRSSTSLELQTRLNHDRQVDKGGTISHSRQTGNFQFMLSAQSRPNYENRDHRETRLSPAGDVLGTLFEVSIREQDVQRYTSNLRYRTGSQRMQLNMLFEDSSHPRTISRDFVDFLGGQSINRLETEDIDHDYDNWEVGGEYELILPNAHRLQMLFISRDQTRNDVRDRFDVSATEVRNKSLFIASNQRTREDIVQGNYSFRLSDTQDLRVGLERADTRLDSTLFIGNRSGTLPPTPQYGGLSPRPELSNPGTRVQEIRHEGFVFHNWAINSRSTLESSVVLESSEISQSGVVEQSRTFEFVRPSVDYRYTLTDQVRLRATIERSVAQLSFANFSATARNDDREQDANAGNPQLVPQKELRYELGIEYRFTEDSGVINTRFYYRAIEDYIGRINATVDPAQPLSATGNVGPAARWGIFNDASLRLTKWGLPDAIVSARLNVFDSKIIDPFLGTRRRINRRGEAELGFRHDVTSRSFSYGIDYRQPFHGGEYAIDINTITRFDQQPNMSMFVSRVLFNNVTFRLEADNVLRQSQCRERQRFNGTTISGTLRLIEDSCSSRYQRVILRMQTTF